MKRLLRHLDSAALALALAGLLVTLGAIVFHRALSFSLLWAAIAWCFVVLLLLMRKHVEGGLLWSAKLLGVGTTGQPVEQLSTSFATQFTQFYYAARAFRGEEQNPNRDLGASLRRIAKSVYTELNATAVEFALYDEVSKQWSQALVIGAPKTINSQGMLGDPLEIATRQVFAFDSHQVIVMPVALAGNVFGALRVEMPIAQTPSRSETELLEMFAIQGAIALVDTQFTTELFRMRRVSEESVRAKTGFLANLSHEIRGPLGIILNGVELIRDGLCGPVTEQQQSTLKMIKDSGDHLLDLVNDVLDYAKVEAGKIIPKTVRLSAIDLLEDLVSVVRTQAIEKGHTLELLPAEPGLGIYCDKRHARQMMINLLTNAVKYTPNGGKITVSVVRSSGNRLKISVQDTGIGIAPEQQGRVFAPFERVEDSYALAQGGTGLGMPLTRRLAEVNGGSVDFVSKPGEGSTFWILLPTTDADSMAVSETIEDGNGSEQLRGRGEHVLLVDHDADTRHMLSSYLTSQGFVVVEAASGAEVLKALRNPSIAIGVVENDMPDLPGEDMVSAIRSTPRAGSLPLVLLTSRAFVFDIERFLRLGVDRCLSKPVNLSEVSATVRRLIDENTAVGETPEPKVKERKHILPSGQGSLTSEAKDDSA